MSTDNSERPRTTAVLEYAEGFGYEIKTDTPVLVATATIPMRLEHFNSVFCGLAPGHVDAWIPSQIAVAALRAEELETTGVVLLKSKLIDDLVILNGAGRTRTVRLAGGDLCATFESSWGNLNTWKMLRAGPGAPGWLNLYVEVMIGTKLPNRG